MTVGINSEKMATLNIDLLDAIESINAISSKLDIEINIISNNFEGPGKDIIINKLNLINNDIGTVNKNIYSYINDLSNVKKVYAQQDVDLSTSILNNIEKIEERSDN